MSMGRHKWFRRAWATIILPCCGHLGSSGHIAHRANSCSTLLELSNLLHQALSLAAIVILNLLQLSVAVPLCSRDVTRDSSKLNLHPSPTFLLLFQQLLQRQQLEEVLKWAAQI
jgi:hypothetical protein